MKINGKRVFVSGGAGVIGLEMIPRLVERGAIVMVGDLKSRPTSFAAGVIYRQGDLNAMTAWELAQFNPEAFIHLAATFERSTESYDFWEENFWHNVRLSHHLMSIAKDMRSLRRVVFASSYLIYDPKLYQFSHAQSRPVALKESDPVLPRNLTGAAKFIHEIELRFIDHFRSEQFTTVCARIYRGYGRNSRDVISRWVRDLLRKQSITVYRPEGLFDYVYAADTAEGLIRLAENDQEVGILNLGTGRARRVQEVVDVLRNHFPEMVVNAADSDIPFEASQADMSRYQRGVGWVPGYTLETAIPEIIAFERKKLEAPAVAGGSAPIVLISSSSGKTHWCGQCKTLHERLILVGGLLQATPPHRLFRHTSLTTFGVCRRLRMLISTILSKAASSEALPRFSQRAMESCCSGPSKHKHSLSSE